MHNQNNMAQEKPPLGVIPEWLHKEQRRDEINAAITRYFDAVVPIPPEWLKEQDELNEWLLKFTPSFAKFRDTGHNENDSVKKIKIDMSRDFIIIEKFKNEVILSGSMLYCGCCGHALGQAEKNISLPCVKEVFISSLRHETISFTPTILGGLHHDTCKRAMFIGSKAGWRFMELLNYQSQMLKISINEN